MHAMPRPQPSLPEAHVNVSRRDEAISIAVPESHVLHGRDVGKAAAWAGGGKCRRGKVRCRKLSGHPLSSLAAFLTAAAVAAPQSVRRDLCQAPYGHVVGPLLAVVGVLGVARDVGARQACTEAGGAAAVEQIRGGEQSSATVTG